MKTLSSLLAALALLIFSTIAAAAPAAMSVGTSALDKPTGGVTPVDVSHTFGPGTAPLPEFIFVQNVPDPNRLKLFWLKVTMDTNGFPQAPGEIFNQDLWPLVTAPAATPSNPPYLVTVTGASDVAPGPAGGPWVWYLTGSIWPQPAWEVILFDNNPNWYGTWASHVTQIEFSTVCVPIPEPDTYAMLLGGLGLLGFMARRKAKTPT